MRSLTLTEHSPSGPVTLSPDELAALRALAMVRIEAASEPGSYVLTAGSSIGVVDLPTLSVTIRPKLPIERVLFLISYALDPVRWQTDVRLGGESGLLEWLVPVFVSHARRAFRGGLVRGYREEEESGTTLRGRLRFDEQVRRHYGRMPPVEMRYDEYTADIELNRLVRAAARRLGRLPLRHEQSRRSLLQLDVALDGVRHVEYHPRAVPAVTLTRLNDHYRPLINLSRLVLQSSTLTFDRGKTAGTAFLVDMNRVFENFVVIALREALGLSEREFPQGVRGRRLSLTVDDEVRLEPDMSWWDGNRCMFVGDAKYKKLRLAGYEHADLYQLLAYTTAADLPAGLLVYAKGEQPTTTYRVRHAGTTLEVVALRLDGPPDGVLADVREVAGRIRRMRSQSMRRMSRAA